MPKDDTAQAPAQAGRRLFGTDGIRGTANRAPMDAATALRLGQAAGRYFNRGTHRHRVVIGKDTRLSGYMLEPALTAGFIGAGMDVVIVGPLPTPAIALLTRSLRADLGVMISASHNPYEDNGIKLFGPDGLKLSDQQETEIEALMAGDLGAALVGPGRLGRASRMEDAPGRYIEAVKSSFPRGLTLEGLRVVVDTAHGAAYRVAPTVLWELGAEVVRIGDAPDGFNINQGCGSTAPTRLAELVRERRADLGIALDGDADRLVLVDEGGAVVDGDQILALIARSWHEEARLRGGAVVATVMSNIGLERFLAARGLDLQRTAVGDRYVGERMREVGCNLGGEQSGHMIMADFGTTGDGLVAALQVLAVLVAERKPASHALRCFPPLPQRLVNVRFDGARDSPLNHPAVQEEIARHEVRLGARGRVLIRPSGTEPVIRVMAEAEEEGLVEDTVQALAEAIRMHARAPA
jgi:phosphoglucosamine mutase